MAGCEKSRALMVLELMKDVENADNNYPLNYYVIAAPNFAHLESAGDFLFKECPIQGVCAGEKIPIHEACTCFVFHRIQVMKRWVKDIAHFSYTWLALAVVQNSGCFYTIKTLSIVLDGVQQSNCSMVKSLIHVFHLNVCDHIFFSLVDDHNAWLLPFLMQGVLQGLLYGGHTGTAGQALQLSDMSKTRHVQQ